MRRLRTPLIILGIVLALLAVTPYLIPCKTPTFLPRIWLIPKASSWM
ncbi:MAG: hypothetical protein R2856_09580 [Caldilineaceae bacterium]